MKSRLKVFFAVLAALILYTGVEFGRLLPSMPAYALWLLTLLFFWFIVGWQFLYRSRPQSVRERWFAALAWAGSLAFGVWATYVPLSLPFEAAGRLGHHGALALAGAATAIAALGFGQVRLGPRIERVTVPVAGLAPGLHGLRIAQISDLHVGATIRDDYVSKVVDAVLSLEPDLIAVTGDLADGSVSGLAEAVRPLARLSAPLGVYYVTGNHEYYWDARAWLGKAAELGFTALVDENRVVTRNGAKLLVGGVPDTAADHFIPEHKGDAARAAAGEADFKVLLAHRPDSCLDAEPAGFGLQLSGHTHGGQFFPYSLLIRFFHRYHRGLNRHGRMWVYVNPGTGYWGPPHRFAVPSEITLLTLSRV